MVFLNIKISGRRFSYRLKSKSGRETFPSCSGGVLCRLESGDPLLFWFKTPNRVRHSTASRGSTATAIGKFILKPERTHGEEKLKSESQTQRAHSQLIPFDVVEEAPVGAHPFGLNGFEKGFSVVGQRAHHKVLLKTATKPDRHRVINQINI